MAPHESEGVKRGQQCDAHVGIVKEITQLQVEVLHMKNEFARMATGIEQLVQKIEPSKQPEITKTFITLILALFSGGSAIIVALVTNADKIQKLIGWGG